MTESDGKPGKRLSHRLFSGSLKSSITSALAQIRERRKLMGALDQMVVIRKLTSAHATILGKVATRDTKPAVLLIGSTDIIRYVLAFFSTSSITALRHGNKAVLNFAGHAAGSIAQQRREGLSSKLYFLLA